MANTNKKKGSSTARKEAQKIRTARNKAKAQARHAARLKNKGDGSGRALHALRNRLKRIGKKLKTGLGADRVERLKARQVVIKNLMERGISSIMPPGIAVS